jgi:hypothetical protein
MHLPVDLSKLRFCPSSRRLFQRLITSPTREEALTLAKRRFIEYETVRNDINIIPDPNLYEGTTHIIFDESLFHIVKNVPNEFSGVIVILERNYEILPFLETANKTKVKAVKDICGVRWESENLSSVGGKFI